MKEYKTESIRNVALVSHSGAGKTMLAEALLHFSGVTTRLGSITDGTTASDFDEEEVRRQLSLYATVLPVEYKNHKVNIIDTPGFTDFIGEEISALSVSDAALVLVDSVSGFEVGTEMAWNYSDKFNLPRFLVINKMDRDNANFIKALNSVKEVVETRLIPVQIPWGEEASFQAVIDLFSMKAFKAGGEVVDVPAEYLEEAQAANMELIESAAESSEALMEKYFEEGSLSSEEIMQGLAMGVQAGDFVLVFCSAATSEIGLTPLMDAILTLLPSPADRPAVMAQGPVEKEELTCSDASALASYVWKTTADPFVGKQTYFRVVSGMIESDSRYWNQDQDSEERFGTVYVPQGKEMLPVKVIHAGDLGVVPKLSETATGNTISDKAHPLILPLPEYPNALYRVAVFPKTQADSTKISPTLNRLCQEDMTLSWKNDPATRQTVLQGMGDQHIDVIIRRAKTKFQVNLLIDLPKVAYREAIRGEASAQYRHKKQSGGSGQFGEVHLKVLPSNEDFEFSNDIFGGSISSNYMPAIEKGIKAVMREGVLVGFPISGIKVSVYDGKEHPVDSKPVAFEVAGREAFKLAFMKAKPVLFEPIMMVKVTVPDENMGDILGDMNTRRARVQGMDNNKGRSVINATVPLGEMLRYTTELRSMTGGRGVFDMEFSSYEMVPSHVTKEIVAAREKELEEK
ncbi:MAG: elongation factor G [Anaerolineaceae bacterium]|nr:elongation factor G [Anaerolineaceae bacterium]